MRTMVILMTVSLNQHNIPLDMSLKSIKNTRLLWKSLHKEWELERRGKSTPLDEGSNHSIFYIYIFNFESKDMYLGFKKKLEVFGFCFFSYFEF
jgi:hypothetical protein